jgi:hypothetical protein
VSVGVGGRRAPRGDPTDSLAGRAWWEPRASGHQIRESIWSASEAGVIGAGGWLGCVVGHAPDAVDFSEAAA